MRNKIFKSGLSLTLALVLVLSVGVFGGTVSQAAPTLSEIQALKDEAAELTAEKDALSEKIDDTENEQFVILAKKKVLDEKIELTKAEIKNISEQIELYGKLIEEKEAEVQKAQEREDQQLALYKERVRRMEEYGSISYLAVLFDAASFSDLLARLDFIFEVMNYDEKLYHNYIESKEETQAAKVVLEETQAELEATKADLEDTKAEFDGQRKEADEYIAELESTLEGYMALYAEADAAEAEKWAEVDRLLAEYQAEQDRLTAANGGGSNDDDEEEDEPTDAPVGNGIFIWPVPASYWVTSEFGWRTHPVYGDQRHHNGIDIGADYYSNILAADGGTVLCAYYDWSYGNFVMIDHGNGFVTLYAHMEELYVSEGEYVSQGEVVGLCGSTGTSTGPHLHFEVRYDGTFVDPLDYLSDYPYMFC